MRFANLECQISRAFDYRSVTERINIVKRHRLCELVDTKSLTAAVVVALKLAAAKLLAAARVAQQLQFQFQRWNLFSRLQHQKQCQLQLLQLIHRPSSLHDCTTISQRRAALLVCSEWHDSHVDLRWERTASCSVTSSL